MDKQYLAWVSSYDGWLFEFRLSTIHPKELDGDDWDDSYFECNAEPPTGEYISKFYASYEECMNSACINNEYSLDELIGRDAPIITYPSRHHKGKDYAELYIGDIDAIQFFKRTGAKVYGEI